MNKEEAQTKLKEAIAIIGEISLDPIASKLDGEPLELAIDSLQAAWLDLENDRLVFLEGEIT